MSSSSDVKMQDLLDAITVALQHDDDIDNLIKQSSVPREDIDNFVNIIQSLNTTFTPVKPSAKFANKLHNDLMGTRPTMVNRVRQMPARVHIAALVALIAGFVLIGYRRIFTSATTSDITEEVLTI